MQQNITQTTQKIKKHYYFNKDVIEHADNNQMIKSFPDWVCEKYYEEFCVEETLIKKIGYMKEQLELAKLKNSRNIFKIMSEKEILWIRDIGIQAIRKTTLNGVYRRFKYKFNSQITKRQFMLTLSRMGVNND